MRKNTQKEYTMKKIFVLLVITIFTVSTAFAISGGNPRKGRSLFKKNCKSCHVKGAEGGVISPLDKTMEKWDTFFKKGEHPGSIFTDLSEKDKTDIWQLMFDYAVDTDQPDSCDQ